MAGACPASWTGACPICTDPLDNGEQVSTLACGHQFHEVCIVDGCQVAGVTLAEFRCPTCRHSAESLMSAEMALTAPDVRVEDSQRVDYQRQDAFVIDGHRDDLASDPHDDECAEDLASDAHDDDDGSTDLASHDEDDTAADAQDLDGEAAGDPPAVAKPKAKAKAKATAKAKAKAKAMGPPELAGKEKPKAKAKAKAKPKAKSKASPEPTPSPEVAVAEVTSHNQ